MTTVRFLQDRLFVAFAADFVRQNGGALQADFVKFRQSFTVADSLLTDLVGMAAARKLDFEEKAVIQDRDFIRRRIKSEIARNLWGTEKYHEIEAREDLQIKSALAAFPEALKLKHHMVEN
jgi:hypothetical protein